MVTTVTILQRRLTDYRVSLFEKLRYRLLKEGIQLRLLHGQGNSSEALKSDAGLLQWAEYLPTHYYFGAKLCWQPFAQRVIGDDLVIMTQENGLLANHLALARRPCKSLAFWGHGGNFQGNSGSLRERYKRWSTRRVDWYFAYTALSVDLVTQSGFPRERVTCLNNAVDIDALKHDLAELSYEEIRSARYAFGLDNGPVGLFLGSLYTHKRVDFLIDAAKRLRENVDGFQLLVIGDGPDRSLIEGAARDHPWIQYVGPRRGKEKAAALRIANIMLNPGLVGLGILDSFAAAVPLVTTDCGLHSPEIAYLVPENGIMTANNLGAYVDACQQVLRDRQLRDKLVRGCERSANRYTLINMVENFADGITQALGRQN